MGREALGAMHARGAAARLGTHAHIMLGGTNSQGPSLGAGIYADSFLRVWRAARCRFGIGFDCYYAMIVIILGGLDLPRLQWIWKRVIALSWSGLMAR